MIVEQQGFTRNRGVIQAFGHSLCDIPVKNAESVEKFLAGEYYIVTVNGADGRPHTFKIIGQYHAYGNSYRLKVEQSVREILYLAWKASKHMTQQEITKVHAEFQAQEEKVAKEFADAHPEFPDANGYAPPWYWEGVGKQ